MRKGSFPLTPTFFILLNELQGVGHLFTVVTLHLSPPDRDFETGEIVRRRQSRSQRLGSQVPIGSPQRLG